MVIGLAGKKGSGKDTVGAYLVKNYGFKRLAFADPLKESLAAALDIPRWDVDKYKLDDTCYVAVGHINEPEKKFERQPSGMWSPIRIISFREFLQQYGTEAHRDVFGENFWVDAVLPKGIYAGRKLVITDVRFPNEAQRISDIGGYVWKIERPIENKSDDHRSESLVDSIISDATITNSGSIDDLFASVESLLTSHRGFATGS